MVLPGHLAGGYLTGRAILQFATSHGTAFSPEQSAALLVISTLAGEGPDIDLAYVYVRNLLKHDFDPNHRLYVTHFPLFWLILSSVAFIAGQISGSAFVSYVGAAIWLGSWSHLALDSIEYGVPWLAPFSNRMFALSKVGESPTIDSKPGTLRGHWEFVSKHYIKWKSAYVEIAVTAIALWVAFHG